MKHHIESAGFPQHVRRDGRPVFRVKAWRVPNEDGATSDVKAMRNLRLAVRQFEAFSRRA